jgi:hypothetical protein
MGQKMEDWRFDTERNKQHNGAWVEGGQGDAFCMNAFLSLGRADCKKSEAMFIISFASMNDWDGASVHKCEKTKVMVVEGFFLLHIWKRPASGKCLL